MRLHPGYTLVEFLIYIAIAAVFLVVASNLVFSLLDGKAKLQATAEVSQMERAVMERIQIAIRNASSVTSPSGATSGTQLILVMPIAAQNPTMFSLVSSTVVMKEGSSATTTLTSDEIQVQQLKFWNVSATGTPASIRIQIAASSTNPANDPNFSASQPLYGSATVRTRL
jgi:Tfp pilus assembly protein PilW